MEDEIEQLRKEVLSTSCRIHALQSLIEETEDPVEADKLKKELKQLQWQALFYLEKIENLQSQGGDDH